MAMDRKRWLQWGLAFLAGGLTTLLSVVAFPPYDMAEAGYFFQVPVLLWMLFARPGWKTVFSVASISGLVSWTMLLFWLRHFPEQVDIPFTTLVGWCAVLGLAAILSLFFSGWSLISRWFLLAVGERNVAFRLMSMLGIAGAWVFLEWVRSWLFTGFPWLPLSASQWQRPMVLQIAAYTGAYGVSFMLILFNLGLTFYIQQMVRTRRLPWWRRFSVEFYLALAVMLVSIGIGWWDFQQTKPQRIFQGGFVQPYVQPQTRWDSEMLVEVLGDYRRVAEYAAWDGAEVILWPEASTPLPAPGNREAEQWLAGISKDLELPVLMGNLAASEEDEGHSTLFYNAIITVTPQAGVSEIFYAKRHLVPFGEYIPRWIPFIDKVVPLDGQFVPGTEAKVLKVPVGERIWRAGPLVCYEDIFPNLSRDLVLQGCDFIFVAANNAWYGEEGAPYQHAAHSVLRAVETRRPVLRSGNGGWSGWIDERGRIRHQLTGSDGTVYFQGADSAEIFRDPYYSGVTSFYVRFGDWFVAVCAGLIAIASVVMWRMAGCRKEIPLSDRSGT